jgi:hypothetical protein
LVEQAPSFNFLETIKFQQFNDAGGVESPPVGWITSKLRATVKTIEALVFP